MLTAIVRTALSFPRLVVLAAILLVADGSYQLFSAEFEVFPEFVPAQASVQVEAPGFTAAQVELLITRPLEEALRGATGVASVRSDSIQGLTVVDVTFRAGEDPYRVRQVVAERLAEVGGRLPAGTGAPTLSPLTSSTMDLLKLGLTSERLTLMELREFAQWTLRPLLLAKEGVARINIFGGELERIEVRIREQDMLARDIALTDVMAAVEEATRILGGGFVDTSSQRINIELRGAAFTPEGIAAAVIFSTPGGVVTVGDVADVVVAPAPKFGDASVMGKDGVLLTLSSQYGANTLTTTRVVETALAELQPALDRAGITLYPALHRPANFIETALDGIRIDLLLGAFLIIIVLLAFTHDLRVALVAFVSVPFSLLAALLVFDISGQAINTMILGGLAVALGVVIDDAVIGTENILRRLRENGHSDIRAVVLAASVEVRAPVVYATFVLALTMAPVLFLSGLQGAFFSPLAAAFLLATFASLLVALTLTPALAFLLLSKTKLPKEPALLHTFKQLHGRLLRPLCKKPGIALVLTLLIGLVSVLGFMRFGAELLPSFREGHYVLAVNGPSGVSIGWMHDQGDRITRDLLAIPGVATVEQQIGRAEAGEDTFPPSESEFHVELAHVSGAEEDRILAQIRTVLASYPGMQTEALTFLGDRIGESLSGETAAIVVSAYGPDLDVLDQVADRIAAVISSVPHVVDVQIQAPPGAPGLAIEFDPSAMTLYGIRASDVFNAIEATYQGKVVSQVMDGIRLTDVAVTVPAPPVQDPESAGAILVRSQQGTTIPLSEIAHVGLITSRASISHDNGRRRQVITANSDTADVAGTASLIQTEIANQLTLPEGVYLEFSGMAEGEAAARQELLINVALAAIGIVVLLVLAFGGGRPAILILSSAPGALAGGVIVIAFTSGVVSLGSLVGFVTLFGIAARNSILLVSHAEHLVEKEGAPWGMDTVLRASSERLAPILMTALVTALGMMPLAMGSGEAGREVQGPMAQVILGGLASSTLLSLFLLPPLLLAYLHSSRSSSV
jgi:CzcA family heavy metal efflux pump